MTKDHRPHPETVASERLLLGAILRDPLILDDSQAIGLRGLHFYRVEHQRLFELLVDMNSEGVPIDPSITVPEAVMRSGHPEHFGGLEYVVELPDRVPATANWLHYAERILDDSHRRTVIEQIDRTKDALIQGLEAPDRLADTVIDALSRESIGIRSGWRSLAEVQGEVLSDVEEQAAHGSVGRRGISTGLRDLDAVIARLQRTDLTVLAARPGMGKTAMLTNIAEAVAKQGEIVGVFSLEMGADQLARRSLAGEAKVSGQSIRLGQFTGAELTALRSARAQLDSTSRWIYVDDTPSLTISEIRARSRRLARMVGRPGLIAIDYLQLLGDELGQRANREREVAHASAGAKALAKELDCAVLLLSQLNRSVETTKDKRPQLQHLRESGAIEQDADQVLFLFRPGYYRPADAALRFAAECIIAKNRHGACKTVDLNFDGERSRFFDLTVKQLQHGGLP